LIWRLFIGVGKLKILVNVAAATSVLSILMSVTLIKPFGLSAVALGILLVSAIRLVVFVWQLQSYFGVPPLRFVWETNVPPLSAAAGFGLACFGMFRWLKAETYLAMTLGFVLALPIYGLMVYFLALTGYERELLSDRLRRWAVAFVRVVRP
jgi:peptidoglycan biosynthesis protein MviN/MurJ (putative lipid II flippase)